MVDIVGSLLCVPSSRGFRVRLSLGCAGVAMLAACASGNEVKQAPSVAYYESHAHHGYEPPGPPSDPWGPYINEASAKFDVPAQWIREVMHVESGGHEYINGQLTVSAAGAMGLMQLEPETYREMAADYGLGADPFNPYDNIMAGTAYIHAMYQMYGSPGFLAAYDAGPGRLNAYMSHRSGLPEETVNYVAMIAPHIQGYYPAQRSDADQLALNTMPMGIGQGILPPGFVPEAPAPYASAEPVEIASNQPATMALPPASYVPPPAVLPSVVSSSALASADLALPAPQPAPIRSSRLAMVAERPHLVLPPPPPHSFSVFPEAMADTPPPVQSYSSRAPHSGWAIQVGAYDTSSHAQAALGIAELSAVQMLMGAHPTVISVHAAGQVKYRARFVGLMRDDALHACNRLAGGPTGCIVLSPEEQS